LVTISSFLSDGRSKCGGGSRTTTAGVYRDVGEWYVLNRLLPNLGAAPLDGAQHMEIDSGGLEENMEPIGFGDDEGGTE
jgi:hypothetical protein